MGHWKISDALEPIYVDDPWDYPDYDQRDESMDCMMCPLTREECDNRDTCYWDEVWGTTEYWHDSMVNALCDKNTGDDVLCEIIESLQKEV